MGLWSWITGLFKKKPKPTIVNTNIGDKMGGKALFVGINKYPSAPLAGCVYDVDNVSSLAMQNYGFSSSQICILKDHEATTANILAKLNWLVDVNPGERVIFHFSGHGTQIPTSANNEADQLSEIICPVDFDWSKPKLITDKQLIQIFERIPAGCIFNWISDSCHSGDMTREMPMVVPNTFFAKIWYKLSFWKKPKYIQSRSMPVPPHMMLKIGALKAKGVKAARAMAGGVLDVGFISGCKSNQTSADTEMNGQPCGALTYFLVKNLKATPHSPINDVVAAVNRDLRAYGFTQEPQAEGARVNKPFLL